MFSLSIHYQVAGAHVHADFFMGQGPDLNSITRGRCGSLTFREDEWQVFVSMLKVPEGAECRLINVLTGEARLLTHLPVQEPKAFYGTPGRVFSTDQGEPLVRGMPGHPDNEMGM